MEKLEELRKKSFMLMIISIALLILGIILMFAVSTYLFILTVVGLIMLIVSIVMGNNFKKNITAVFKEEFEKRYPGYTYDKNSGVNINRVYQGGLIAKRADKFRTEDLITAKFNNGTVYTSDLKMIEVREYRDSNGNRRKEEHTFFLGKYFIFDFDIYEFEINLRMFEKGLAYANVSGLTKCETESIAFNEKYKTYVNNELELYKFLKPQVIEKLTEIEKRYRGSIGFSIFANQIHIAIYNNQDSMEFSISKKINEDVFNRMLGKTHDEIENMIEFLDVNNEKYSR